MKQRNISASIPDSNKIPKVTTTFLGSTNTPELEWTLSDIEVSGKSKMGASTGSTLCVRFGV